MAFHRFVGMASFTLVGLLVACRGAAPTSSATTDESFHFAIIGDNAGGTRPGVLASAFVHLGRMRPDFVMSVGDLVAGFDGTQRLVDVEAISSVRQAFDADVSKLGVPFFRVPGNNDMFTQELHDDWRERYGPTYYSFVRNNVLFVVLDSDDPPGTWSGGIGAEQRAWLEGVLLEHPAVDWTLVFLHRPLWLEQPDAWRPVEDAFGDRPRTLFAGHWHSYVRGKLGEHDYFVLATTGGASDLSGLAHGSFDHVVWVSMSARGPRLTNLHLPGIWDENPVAAVEGELSTRIRAEGVAVARDALRSGTIGPEAAPFGEAQMNALGRELAFEGKLEQAATVLELLLAGYPDTWRGHEGLAEVRRSLGDTEAARRHYERTLELMPGNRYARERLESLGDNTP